MANETVIEIQEDKGYMQDSLNDPRWAQEARPILKELLFSRTFVVTWDTSEYPESLTILGYTISKFEDGKVISSGKRIGSFTPINKELTQKVLEGREGETKNQMFVFIDMEFAHPDTGAK